MNTLEIKLQSPQAKQVFRRFRILPGGMAGVRLGYEKYGTPFMVALLKAISPPTSVLNGNFGDDEIGPPLPDNWDSIGESTIPSSSGVGWDWFQKALTIIGETGQTIGQFKDNISGVKPATDTAAPTPAAASQSNTILYIVGGVLLLGIIFFIFKKQSA